MLGFGVCKVWSCLILENRVAGKIPERLMVAGFRRNFQKVAGFCFCNLRSKSKTRVSNQVMR